MYARSMLLAMLFVSQFAHACAGDELSFTFDNLDLRAAFAVLADFSKTTPVIDQSIAWTGPINFGCTSWRKAAKDLAKQHNLKLEIRDGKMIVSK